jgi:preflagellin peptidase FlaK
MLDILKILFCTPFLLYSCYSDIKTRRVTNRLWLVMLAGAVFFVLYDIMTKGTQYIMLLFLSAGSIFVLAYILFQLGTFGGADAKSLIVISIILPSYPVFSAFGFDFPLNKPLFEFFSFGILGNAVLLTVVVPLGLALYNISRMGLRIDNPLYIFIGYKSRISDLADKHIKLIQSFEEENGLVKFRFIRGGLEIDETVISKLKVLSEKGIINDEVWVTPGLPFMIPITLGFFVAVVYGDMITELTKYLILIR